MTTFEIALLSISAGILIALLVVVWLLLEIHHLIRVWMLDWGKNPMYATGSELREVKDELSRAADYMRVWKRESYD
ncbi:MAG TPA: hypothetical protein VNQ99_12255 [Xanthobacteraceae bacterium]|nr:hypothetical protein [Xanthobacteraceae bacterium]